MVNSLFFQAEDGIRARDVTGVQTCALPISEGYGRNFLLPRKLAIEASEGNKAVIAQMKAASVRRSAKEKAQAEELEIGRASCRERGWISVVGGSPKQKRTARPAQSTDREAE